MTARDLFGDAGEFMRGASSVSWIFGLFICAASLLVSVLFVTYQLFFHPLAKYPGPLLGRITPLYDLYHAYIGDKHLLLYHLHQKHGRIVRFTPNTLSLNDPAALQAVYGHNANAQKSEFYRCFRAAPTAISSLLATDKEQSARKRRIIGQAFSDPALKGLEPHIVAHVEELVGKLRENARGQAVDPAGWSEALNLRSWCNWLAFDVMGDLVFGKSFGTLGEQPENRRGIHLLNRAARRNYSVAAMPVLAHRAWEQWLPPFKGLYQDRNQYLAFGRQQVLAKMEREKEGTGVQGRKDIFSILLHAKDPETGERVPMPELWMEANTLIVAGSDTTSTTLAATLFYLLKSPSALARLEQEIRNTFQHADDIRMGPQLQSCAWLRACINETMRMSPALPALLPREVLPGGLAIPTMQLSLPAGINVGVPTYALHHNANYITNPFTFDPSRWLADADAHAHAQDPHLLRAVFNPFSQGPRACLGKPLVYMELGIAIARVVFGFDLRLAAEQHAPRFVEREVRSGKRHGDEYQMQDWFLSHSYGPWAELREREVDGRDGLAEAAKGTAWRRSTS